MESDREDNKPVEKNQSKIEDKPEDLVIQKIAEGTVEGHVACVEGPIRNATVSVGMIYAFSDSKGNFLLEHLPPGIGKIKVKSPTNRFYDSSLDIMVEADMRKNISVFLEEVTGTIEGVVSDQSGEPLSDAEISGIFRPTKEATVVKTDERGHYIMTEVPRGVYFIRAKARGHMTEGAKIDVVGGISTRTNFTLSLASLSITGKVLSKEGSPIDCEIFLTRKGVVVARTKTTSSGNGEYAFNDLVPDFYEIGTTSSGHTPKGWLGKLEKSEIVNFELEPIPSASSPSSRGR